MNKRPEIKTLIILFAIVLMIVNAFVSCEKPEPEIGTVIDTDTEPVPEESAVEDITSAQETAEATCTVNVGGVVIRSQIAGAYSIKGFAGFAVRMNADAIRALAGIAGTPFVRAYDITPKKNAGAFSVINAAAASVGATVLGAINVDLGQMNGGKFSSLNGEISVPATLGVAQAGGRTLAVVKVLPGGAFEILQDSDEISVTVTFNITGGLNAYAVIAY